MTLQEIFSGIDRARIGVIGDFCLDVYWKADMTRSVLSRETPHYPLPVVEERMYPGGAGNVVWNIAALRPKAVMAFGVVGQDWRGTALRELLQGREVDTKGLIAARDRVTNAYIKPLRQGISDLVYEDPRLDFENDAEISSDIEERLLQELADARLDMLCVCDQMRFGCITSAVRARICQLGKVGQAVLVDSRERIALYQDVMIKPNEVEAMRALGQEQDYAAICRKLRQHAHRPVIITLGEKGCLVCQDETVAAIPAEKVEPPIDICGAGDTFMSALACALSVGATLEEAARMANCASAVTIQKIGMTGTASREEIARRYAIRQAESG